MIAKNTVDFDLHGIVGIRLVGAGEKEVATVARQVGPILQETPFDRDPDITIRFVDELPSSGRLHYLDLDDVAFDDEQFYVLRGKHKSRTKVQIPFQDIGQHCEIVCERGLSAVPLLIDIVNAIAIDNGYLPLHASAFNFNGVGVLATGWTKGGKTETLLAFMANGAEYVGDEWVYLSRDGQRMFGIPEPIRIWKWHLDYLPSYESQLGRRDRTRLRMLNAAIGMASPVAGNGKPRRGPAAQLMSRMVPLMKRQLHVDWAPAELFGESSLTMAGSPDKLLFVVSHATPDVTVEPIAPSEVARRMWFSLQEERDDFMAYYRKFRFAFPDRPNELIERTPQLQREHLDDALAGKEAYMVCHPYPVVIPDMFDAIRPLCMGTTECSPSH